MKTVDFFKQPKSECPERRHKRRHREHDNNHISKELRKGIKVESEHKGTIDFLKHHVKSHGKFPEPKEIYKSIAKDHLRERKDYYKKLSECVED